jgi:Ca2+-binding RTX toxin-like protein
MAIFKTTINYAVAGLPISLTVGDFNGDGKSDLVVGTGNTGTGNFSVLLGTGVSGLSTATNYFIFDPSQLPVVGYLAVGDFNGDGKTDLVAAGNATQATAQAFLVALGSGSSSLFSSINLNISGGTFNLPPNLSTLYPTSVAIGDFNGDGKSDLALTTYNQSIVSVAFGNDAGGFGATTNFNVGSAPASVKIGDFNGDGKSDLVVANDASNNVSILLGNGTGGFGATTNFNVGLNPLSVVVGDFNGDGKSDLATANFSSNNVSVLLGNGNGTFGTATNFAVGTNPRDIIIADFNGDGKSDLATANFSSNNVSVLLGNGNGTFGTATNFAVGTSPFALTVGDLDGNGSPDLSVANLYSNNVSVLYNGVIRGTPGNDNLNGSDGNDTFIASAGNDTLTGGNGEDTVDYSQLATSITLQAQGTVNKGALGTDTVQAEVFIGNTAFANAIDAASSTNNSINADLSENSLTVFGLPSGDVTFTVVNFQNVTGSQADDIITGNGAANNLNGSAGDDILFASVGNDILTGGDGVDIVVYGQLATEITLEAQGFVNKGALGRDTVQAETFVGNADFANAIDAASSTNNRINADLSQNSLTVFGLPSGDVTFNVVNFRNVTGSQGSDTITGNDLDNILKGSGGNDTLTGGDGVDTVDYSQLATSITLQAQGTVNKGVLGTDTVQAETFVGNADFANAIDAASSTNNRINADLSQNSLTVFGLPSGDVTFNVVNFQDVTGSQVNDIIVGNDLDNILNGSGGNDTLIASAGNDILTGGNGVDTVDYSQLATSITLQAQGFVNKGTLGTDTVQVEAFIGNAAFANAIDAASSTNNRINADLSQNSLKVFGLPSGDVTFTVVNFQNVTGSQGSDTITGNNLDNILNGGAGADVLTGSTGNDSYYVDNAGDIVKENANEGTDAVFTTISYTLASNLENLTLLGTSAINATGNGLNNSLTGNNAANIIDGGIGNDTLNGGIGNDILLGGVGADDLTGGIGNDLIYLGANDNAVDNVRYTAGHGIDTIYQFVRGIGGDKLNFTGIANFDVITLGTSTSVRISDGIGGNSGFGTGQLLVTLSGTSGFTSANANLNLFGGNFLFN